MSRAIDFGSLLGAQISALVDAEVSASQRTSEFIEAAGFDRDDNDELVLRTVSFEMQRRDEDGVVRPHRVQIPALTLVPLPLLSIESAQLDFELQVESVTRAAEPASPGLLAGQLGRVVGPRHKLVARHARTPAGEKSARADLRVSVKLAQSPFPVGIERLLHVADLSVQDEVDT